MLCPCGSLLAWLVHLYTASSAVFGLWAVVACFRGQFRLAMYLMMLTMVIDSTDGALARLVDVRRQIPWFDGRRLDDICDYFTYVVLPACFLIAAGMLPQRLLGRGAGARIRATDSARTRRRPTTTSSSAGRRTGTSRSCTST